MLDFHSTGQWLIASTKCKVNKLSLSVVKTVPQLLRVPRVHWNTSSTACASPAVERRGTSRSVLIAVTILLLLCQLLGLGPPCNEVSASRPGVVVGLPSTDVGLCDAPRLPSVTVDVHAVLKCASLCICRNMYL